MIYQRLLVPESPGNIPYTDPDTGYSVKNDGSIMTLVRNAREHREANGLPIPDDFAFRVEDQICRQMPGRCVNRDNSPIDLSCIHRGDMVRWQGCDTCSGVKAKIVACAIYGECSEFRKDVGVQSCALCMNRVPALTEGAE